MSSTSTYKGSTKANTKVTNAELLSNNEFSKDLLPGEAPDPKPDNLLTKADVYG